MPPLDSELQALAALATGSFAVLLLAEGRGRRSAMRLGVFLGLVFVNLAAEAVRALVTDPGAQLAWYRLASVAASLDPVALWLFVVAHDPAPARWRTRVAPLVAGASLLLALFALFQRSPPGAAPETNVYGGVLTSFTLLVYGAVSVWALRRLREEDTRAARMLGVASIVLALPVVVRLGDALNALAPGMTTRSTAATTTLLHVAWSFSFLALGSLAALLLAMAWLPRARRGPVWGALLVVWLVVLLTKASALDELLALARLAPIVTNLLYLGRAGTAIRWLVFCAVASVAFLGADELGLTLAARRRASRVLIAVTVLVAAGAALALVQAFVPGRPVEVSPIDVGLLVVAIGLSQGFRDVVDKVATRAYGVPARGDRAAAHALYQRAAAESMRKGSAPGLDPQLRRLREELGIDAETAAILDQLAERASDAGLEEDALVAGRYRVVRLIGRGGSARAFLARDLLLQREVVLKEIPTDAEGESALREARAAGGLQHANVVAVYDVIQRRAASILVTEHVAGGSLEERLRAFGPYAPGPGDALMMGLLQGLARVHAAGIVHGDVKPANVLLAEDGTPKIADFGLARLALGATVDGVNGLQGTLEFMAPEQRRGERATPASDVYALGLLARRALREPRDPAHEAVIARALAPEPAERWQDAREMLAAWRLRAPPDEPARSST